MDRRSSLVLLVVFGTGVFLAGLELMITAVALPSILTDLVATDGTSAWVELRKASWIVNGYLLVYVLDDAARGPTRGPVGRATPVPRGRSAVFTIGSALAGAAQDLDQLIGARLVQAVGGGILVPVGTAGAAHLFAGDATSPRARRHRRPDVPGDGRRTVPGRGDPGRVHPEDALVGAGLGGHRR